MPRIVCIDYGAKKTGIAQTDILQISVNPLCTVPTIELFDFLNKHFGEEEVEKVVIGEPLKIDDSPGDIHHLVIGFKRKIEKLYPNITFVLHNEQFSSQRAKEVIFKTKKKKARRDKTLVDKVAATLILQDYLGHSFL